MRFRQRTPFVTFVLGTLAIAGFGCGGGSPVAGAGGQGVELAVEADSSASFGAVAPFRLTDQGGGTLGLEDLAGSPFCAAAIFTTCAGPCPRITAQMKRLQDELEGTSVRLVSISVDPDYDTPKRLRDYGERWGAGERWSFLTGEKKAVYELVQSGLWLAAQEDEGAPRGFHVTHKTSIVAVDAQGTRRGWYEGTEADSVDRLIERMRFLAQE